MNVLLPLLFLAVLLGTAIIFLLLWSSRRNSPAANNNNGRGNPSLHSFNEEFAAELVPSLTAPSEQLQTAPEPELPRGYGKDRLVLMARDPHWLFAYWEVTATKQDEFINTHSPEAWQVTHSVLRVYDVTGIEFNGQNSLGYTDIHLSGEAGDWYIQVGQPDHSFCVDLGRMFPDGRFITLLRSNTVTTPRASLSDCLDEEWMWIEGLYRTISKIPFGASSPMIIEELAARSGVLPLGVSSPGFEEKKR